jgi:hypothetical protein
LERSEASSLAMSSFPGHQIRHERPQRRSHLELEVIGFGSVTEMPVSKLGMTNKQPRVNPLHAPQTVRRLRWRTLPDARILLAWETPGVSQH